MKFDQVKNLDELLNKINLLESMQKEARVDDPNYNIYEEFNIDMTSLPTFGGIMPMDTSCVYSWDRDRVLVRDGYPTEYIIETRASYFSDPDADNNE